MIVRNMIDSWRYRASGVNPRWRIIPDFQFLITQSFLVVTEWDVPYQPFDAIEGVRLSTIDRRDKTVYLSWYADRGAVFRAIKALLERSASEYRPTQLERGG